MMSVRGFQIALYWFVAVLAGLLAGESGAAQEHTRIYSQDGADIAADIYGSGARGVVLAFDFRGFGESLMPPSAENGEANARFDVSAAVRYLHAHGAETVSVEGASFGGSAAADASAESAPGEIDRVVLLAHGSSDDPELIKGRKLFIVSRHDTDGSGAVRLTEMRKDYKKVPPPKRFIVLEGSAHAQFIFKTSQSNRLMKEIVKFLAAP